MGILYDMYNGKSGFFGERRIEDIRYTRCMNRLDEIKEELLKMHPDIEPFLTQMQETQNEAVSIAEYEMFAAGFRTGAQLMLEMLRGE
mgnify:CR=1 FL=1